MDLPSYIFRPLETPIGINNYPGTVFRCFTNGETLPFRFQINDKSGTINDFTGWECHIIFSNIKASDANVIGDQSLINVSLPLTDASLGLFEGEVGDDDTLGFPDGLAYAQAMFLTPAGAQHIIDMAIIEVFPSALFANL